MACSAGTVGYVNLGAPELLIILVIILLVFGGAKLPKLARSLGQAQKEFKDGVTEGGDGTASAAESSGDDTADKA